MERYFEHNKIRKKSNTNEKALYFHILYILIPEFASHERLHCQFKV